MAHIFDYHFSRRNISIRETCFPIGFTDEDVNLLAKRVYSDIFALRYIK